MERDLTKYIIKENIQKDCDKEGDNNHDKEGDISIMHETQLLPTLKPHFIVKEYYGRTRRESQTFYLEEEIIQDSKEFPSPSIIDQQIHKLQPKDQNYIFPPILEQIALVGGVVLGSVVGLYVYSKIEE